MESVLRNASNCAPFGQINIYPIIPSTAFPCSIPCLTLFLCQKTDVVSLFQVLHFTSGEVIDDAIVFLHEGNSAIGMHTGDLGEIFFIPGVF